MEGRGGKRRQGKRMGGEIREGMGVEVRGRDGEEGRIKWTPLAHKSWRRACSYQQSKNKSCVPRSIEMNTCRNVLSHPRTLP
jgi:hypothetical protein